MSSFNKSIFQSFTISFILSSLLVFVFYLYNSFKNVNFIDLLIFIIPLFLVSFLIIYFYLELFVLKKIRKLYHELIPKNNIEENELVSTNMDQLIEDLKNFSKKSQTEIKSMQEKENFRRDFIGNLAHELKTPLFTSQSYLLTLIDGALKDEEVNLKYLKKAEKAVERLIFIVKDLDMITKLESEGIKLDKSKFNIVSLINNVFEMLELQSSKKQISFSLDSQIKELNVFADQEKIHQVLTNLIENSIKYGKELGTTEVSIEDLVENKVIIRITDNGQGIKEVHFKRLFERFYRVESSGSRSSGGSGLGLAIVKHIVDAHNEKLYVESDYGVGSEFSFTLEKSN
ncbi:MAG: two-component sensor histidine kinase [Flavobacteriaceae bacterium]|nr:two-component sensor histidine kinase [Flavobacteriaceae bacterium]|tara:strand:- start:2059 stop:3090 length:1032 start_codon:yes stop_codon:yes gene_type:complete